MRIEISVRGLEEILERMNRWPQKLDAVIAKTLETILLTVQENVPSYPSPPENSSYRRTGTLGRTLGVSESGSVVGKPDIYEVKKMGANSMARFGTNLEYAAYVIGDKDAEQAWMHQGRWWTLPDVAKNAEEKIKRIWELAAETMAKFIIGGGEL